VIRKVITGFLLFAFIGIGMVDSILHGKMTFSSTMAMDINRVFFYSIYLLFLGSWLLYNGFIVGIGFLALAAFNSYFEEYTLLHNYFASILIYIGLFFDLLREKKGLLILLFICIGSIQGVAFQTAGISKYIVGGMELLSLCLGSFFIINNIPRSLKTT
jgi:hypothetical protein